MHTVAYMIKMINYYITNQLYTEKNTVLKHDLSFFSSMNASRDIEND